jgi:hypothetical protein
VALYGAKYLVELNLDFRYVSAAADKFMRETGFLLGEEALTG